MKIHRFESNDDWILSKIVLNKLIIDGNSPSSIIIDIPHYLRFGFLKASAQRIWESASSEALADAWKNLPEDPDDENHLYFKVPKKIWQTHNKLTDDIANWRWTASRFHTTDTNDDEIRWMMKGVHFLKSDIARLYPASFGQGPARKRGPQRDDSRRTAVWTYLLEMALDGKLADPAAVDLASKGEFASDIYNQINGDRSEPLAGHNIISEITGYVYERAKRRSEK
jgi:hypothetical protein